MITKKNLCQFIGFILLFFICFNLFSQEGDAPNTAWKWYYSRRAFPYDTIPKGAFENAVVQREALQQSNSYNFSISPQWEQIGPLPYAGTYSGRIAHVVYDPDDPNEVGNIIYVTGAYGGLWKTEDGGLNWTNKSGNLPSLVAGAFTLDADRNILYFGSAGFINSWIQAGSGMRIFMSTNDGGNWTSISNGIDIGASIYKIAISPNDANGNTLFAATSLGLFKTTDRGSNWTKIIPDDGTFLICSDVCFSPNGRKVFAVGPSSGRSYPWNLIFDGIGYWRSDDGGDNFSPITNAGFPHSSVLTATTLCAVSKASGAEDLVWFLSFDTDNADDYVYKSTDGGQSFTSRVVGSNYATGYHLSLRASDVDKDICYAGNMNLYKTTDGSQSSWSCIGGYCGMHGDVKGFDINPFDASKITEGNDGGVFRKDGTGSWYSCNDNLGSLSLLWGLASSTYEASFVAGGLHDFTTFSYNSNVGSSTSWSAASGGSGDCGNVLASPFISKHFVSNILTSHQEIYYSSNGTSFGNASGYAASSTYSIEIGPFTNHPSQPGTVYTVRFDGTWGGTQNVQFRKSTDYGSYWGGDATPLRGLQRPSSLDYTAPSFLAISQSDPNVMIMAFTNGNEFWQTEFDAKSGLIKSTNGGLNWLDEPLGNITPIVIGGSGNTPNRAFTDVEFDPKNEDLLYMTVSGYYYPSTNQGHVFKSTNGGYNWESINGDLPDIPVNDIMVHYTGTSTNDKDLIIATDAGIYATNANDINWRELASDFPNTPAFHQDYNRLSGKLNVNTWGRGGWQVQLDGTEQNPGTIYVQDNLYITDDVTIGNPIVVCNGGKLILGHQSLSAVTINFVNNANIVVQDGGSIEATSGNTITMTSSGTWGGIDFETSGYGNLNNVTFQNTATPIVANGSIFVAPQQLTIHGCNFYDGNIQITNRDLVDIKGCHWYYSSGEPNNPFMVSATGSSNLNIEDCTFEPSSLVSTTAIQVVYGTDITIVGNTLTNSADGIVASNCNPVILQNTISVTDPTEGGKGIGLDNSSSAVINENTLYGFFKGFDLYYASPTMLGNSSVCENDDDGSVTLYANYSSSPRLAPSAGDGELIYDAGNNILSNYSNAIFLNNSSYPDIQMGHNTIYGRDIYDMFGEVPNVGLFMYPAECNDWLEYPPSSSKFNISGALGVDFDPYIPNCDGDNMGGGKPSENEEAVSSGPIIINDPPQPIIVNYGNGITDTIMVISKSVSVSADKALFKQALKYELLGNYSSAINAFKTLIQNYQDSLTALDAMKHIFYCTDRSNADSSAFVQTHSYYLGLAQSNSTDTQFAYIAKDFARKSLVRTGNYPTPISEYEDIIEHSTDSAEVLFAELNVIETYLLIEQQGDSHGFTGRFANLKPVSKKQGLAMIREKLNAFHKIGKQNPIPGVFSISQNYPNPFNPLTKINYSIPKNSNVTLKVFDILGRLVKTLVNEQKEAGYYTVQFDGTNLSSGIYFYTIEAGDFRVSKKMVLVK
jgi:parallel beta-helix repeat protein